MGGSKGSVAPVYTAPAAAPAATEAATLVASDVLTEEEDASKLKAKTQGVKSLQIPLGVGVAGTTASKIASAKVGV